MGSLRRRESMPADYYADPCDPSVRRRRAWDGEAWTKAVMPASDPDTGAYPPWQAPWRHHPFGFLGHRPFQVLAASILAAAASLWGYAVTGRTPFLAVSVAASATGAPAAFGLFVDRRLRFGQVVGIRPVLFVALLGGAVAYGLAWVLEGGLNRVPHGATVELILVGPVEESAKLLVPLVLYALGRYRDPRAGLAIALASAGGVAVFETIGYELAAVHEPHAADVLASLEFDRLFAAVLHMTLTGLVAAVAWRNWHLEGVHLDKEVWGAILFSMALHSLNDILNSVDVPHVGSSWYLIVAASYIAFRYAACRLTPPDAIVEVPPAWRPAKLASDLVLGAPGAQRQLVGPSG